MSRRSDPTGWRTLEAGVVSCGLCAADFAGTETAHEPRPVFWARPSARVLIAGQAPGARVHASGRPFTDASGERLRDWLGIGEDMFYDRDRVAILPMAFCFPGYDARGADLPPPKRCAARWRAEVLSHLPRIEVSFLVGGHAQGWHLGRAAARGGVTATAGRWRDHAPLIFPLPHPSWRNTGWLERNPWFVDELLPAARQRLQDVLSR